MKPYFETENGKLYHGDCLEVMPQLKTESIDMILTDPPYGTTACKWDSIIPLNKMWEQLIRLIKPNGATVIFGSEPFSSALRMSNIKNYKYDWVWEKEQGTGFARSKKQPLRKHEIVSVFYEKQPYYNSIGEKLNKPKHIKRKANSNNNSDSDSLANSENRVSIYTHKTKHTILKFNRDRGLHPTQKPVKLISYLAKTYTNNNETVLDFSIGSGTTAIACEEIDRKWVGIEKEEKYCEIAAKRIEQSTAQLRLPGF